MAWRDWRDWCKTKCDEQNGGRLPRRKNGSLFIGLLGKTLVQTCNV